jgi:streptogramin lyase
LAGRVEGVRLVDRRPVRLKGIERPVRLVEVVSEDSLPPVPVLSGGTMRHRRAGRIAYGVAVVAIVAVLGMVLVVGRGSGGGTVALAADYMGVLGTDGTLDQAVGLPGPASGVAYGGGALWASEYSAGEVVEVNPRTGSRVPIPLGPGGNHAPEGIAYRDGEVWVADAGTGSVVEINAQVPKVVQSVYVGNGPLGVAATARAVWVALSVDGEVVEIDPSKAKVVRRISVGADPTQVAVGFGKAWVTNESLGVVTVINARTGVPETPTIPVGLGPNGIAVGRSAVWVTNSLGDTVSRIDPGRETVNGTYPAGNDPQGVAAVAGSVWVAAQRSDQILRLDPKTGQVRSRIAVSSAPNTIVGDGADLATTALPPPSQHRGGTLTVVESGAPTQEIDPDSNGSGFYVTEELLAMTNDGLVAFKRVPGPEGETIVPDLATAIPTPTDGGRTYTFQLRCCVSYSTGDRVHAADIRYGIERLFRINSPGMFALSFYQDIQGATRCTPRRCDLHKGIQVHGSMITFHLSQPDPDFLDKLALPFAVAIPTTTPMRDLHMQPVPATGPYQITSLTLKHAVLERNPGFREWSADAQPAGYPNRIIMRLDTSPTQEVAQVKRGAADWMIDTPPLSQLGTLRARYPSQLHPQPLPDIQYEYLDIHHRPFNNVLARRGFSYAIDRQKIANLKGGPLSATPTCQFLPVNFPGYRPYCPYTVNSTAASIYNGPNPDRAATDVRRSGTIGDTVRVCVLPQDAPVDRYLITVLNGLGYHALPDPSTAAAGCHNGDQAGPFGWAEDYPGPADFFTVAGCPGYQGCFFPWVARRIRTASNAQTQSSADGLAAWSNLDHTLTNRVPLIPLATDIATGFTARRVGNYEYAPAANNDPIIDQMWVK